MLRIVFAEDNYLVREGTVALLAEHDEVEVVATAATMDELLDAVEAHGPDAVLTDIRMPPTNTDEGIRAAKQIRASHPAVGVVVLSQFADDEYVYDLLKDGAEGLGYLLKERVADVDELVRALEEVSRGGSVLDPKVVEALVAAKDRMTHSPLAQLTDREREVLSHMAQGENNAAIAASLFLTERAVEKHINSLFHKLALTE
ncbi:MAG TPA: response regulator transcription factor, partial [Actinomycetota bacterium]